MLYFNYTVVTISNEKICYFFISINGTENLKTYLTYDIKFNCLYSTHLMQVTEINVLHKIQSNTIDISFPQEIIGKANREK